jgi:hypothetical protein
MRKPNYSHQKRQRDVAKQKQRLEKLARRRSKTDGGEPTADEGSTKS